MNFPGENFPSGKFFQGVGFPTREECNFPRGKLSVFGGNFPRGDPFGREFSSYWKLYIIVRV